MNDMEMIKALALPEGKVDAVLDTDAYNEIDDQFAIAYMLRSDEKINVKEIYARRFITISPTDPPTAWKRAMKKSSIFSLCSARMI